MKISLLDIVDKYNSLSIIGMDKNVGKTTVLNHLIDSSRGKLSLGLTSIGRDGEEVDRVTSTEKPKIYVEKGTLIATAKQCLLNGDITREIIYTTGINTPMGEVIIVKALSDGYIELGGPSINAYISYVCNKLLEFGCEIVLVDGAISRKSSACPIITEAAILSTGAALDKDMNKVVDSTVSTLENLSIEGIKDEEIKKKASLIYENYKLGIINGDGSIEKIDVLMALEGAKLLIDKLGGNSKYIVVKGILSDKFLEDICKYPDKIKDKTILVEDGTKIFIKKDTLHKFKKLGGKIKGINTINVICVTVNPTSPYGYEFPRDEFIEKIRRKVSIPVVDVMGGD